MVYIVARFDGFHSAIGAYATDVYVSDFDVSAFFLTLSMTLKDWEQATYLYLTYVCSRTYVRSFLSDTPLPVDSI